MHETSLSYVLRLTASLPYNAPDHSKITVMKMPPLRAQSNQLIRILFLHLAILANIEALKTHHKLEQKEDLLFQ
jgi:hypothetical protein